MTARERKAAARKKWREANPNYQREWRAKNIEACRESSRDAAQRWRIRHPEQAQAYYRANAKTIADKTRLDKAANPEKYRQRERRYLDSNRDTYLLRAARQRAKKLGLPCTLTRAWIRERLTSGVCEVTGIAFAIGGFKAGPWSPSLDRKSPRLGYTPENVQVVVWSYNAAKGTWTDGDVLTLAEAVVSAAHSRRRSA